MRIKIYTLILLFFFVLLILALGRLQIGMYNRYKGMSEGNRLKVVPLMAPRGRILDSKGRAMVKEVLSFNASIIYNKIKDLDTLVELLSSVLEIPKDKVKADIKKCRAVPYSPVCIVSDIGIEKVIQLEELGEDIPGLWIEVSSKREYIYGKVAGNILGYLGSINRPEFDKLKPYGYKIDDMIGRDGIEKYYDEYLRGKCGGKQIEVDYRGREKTILGYKEPIPGKDIFLTIDLDLQKYCDELMTERLGAIVVMNSNTGELLAMVSSPSFDPGLFVDRARRKDISKLFKDKMCPMLNRVIKGTYPPGSVFKAVTGVAALESGAITKNTVFLCEGSIPFGKRFFHCWKKTGHGSQNLVQALTHSCNVFFWRTGFILGVENISGYARMFGIGEKTGIDLPGEAEGVLPSRSWKEKKMKDNWYDGETLNYSIGQGYLLCSPIQVARLMAVFANGGYLVKPYMVSKVGNIVINGSKSKPLDVLQESIDVVCKGLKEVVNNQYGTGIKARLDNILVSGKTGTSQTSKGIDHGWFAGFAPFKKGNVTIVIFDEYGGKGGYYSAETAGKILKKIDELGLIS